MKHHKLLHFEQRARSPPPHVTTSVREECDVTAATASQTPRRRRAHLKIIPVVLSGPLSSVETYALCDEGSTVTLIDASIADVIGADGPNKPLRLQGIASEKCHDNSKTVDFKIRGKFASDVFNIESARTVDRLDFAPESVREEDLTKCRHLRDIASALVYERASPKILLGQDNIELIVTRNLRVGQRHEPVASYTQLGWVLHGCQAASTETAAFCGSLQLPCFQDRPGEAGNRVHWDYNTTLTTHESYRKIEDRRLSRKKRQVPAVSADSFHRRECDTYTNRTQKVKNGKKRRKKSQKPKKENVKNATVKKEERKSSHTSSANNVSRCARLTSYTARVVQNQERKKKRSPQHRRSSGPTPQYVNNVKSPASLLVKAANTRTQRRRRQRASRKARSANEVAGDATVKNTHGIDIRRSTRIDNASPSSQ